MGNNFVGDMIAFFVLLLVITVIIFLVFREYICWYWKINLRVALLVEIRDLLSAKGNSPVEVAPVARQQQTPRFGVDGERLV